MQVSMELRENGWVINFVFTDPWTIQELAPYMAEDQKLRDQSPHPVHMMLNLTNAKRLPQGAISLRHNSPDLNHPTAGHIVLIGTNSFVRSVSETVFRLSRVTRFKIVATEAEGWEYLREFIGDSASDQAE